VKPSTLPFFSSVPSTCYENEHLFLVDFCRPVGRESEEHSDNTFHHPFSDILFFPSFVVLIPPLITVFSHLVPYILGLPLPRSSYHTNPMLDSFEFYCVHPLFFLPPAPPSLVDGSPALGFFFLRVCPPSISDIIRPLFFFYVPDEPKSRFSYPFPPLGTIVTPITP